MRAKPSEILPALFGTFVFLVIIVPFFLIWIPRRILLSPSHLYNVDIGAFRYLGIVPITFGIVIYVFCSGSFVLVGKGTPIPFTPTKDLIITGFYRFVRNPLYIAGIFVLGGEALFFQSIGIFIYCLVMFGIFNIHVFIEETLLEEKFGATYEQYRKSVPRWIPRLKPYEDNESKAQ